MNRRRNRGVALITAILVVAIATIAASAMLDDGNIAIRRTENMIDSERAWWYADGVEAWVKLILQRSRQKNKDDDLGQPWAKPIDYLPIDTDKGGGYMQGQLVDLQGLFNLNDLAATGKEAPKYAAQFQRLIGCIQGLDGYAPQDIVRAVRDWIDPDQEPQFPGGAEDTDYLSLQPPYRAANQPLSSPSELLAINGVDPKLYRALRPYVTALPAVTPVNVNTAPEAVLCSLSSGAAQADLTQFMKSRVTDPVTDTHKLVADGTLGKDLDPGMVTISSNFFELRAHIFVGSGRLALYSVIARPANGSPAVLYHSITTD